MAFVQDFQGQPFVVQHIIVEFIITLKIFFEREIKFTLQRPHTGTCRIQEIWHWASEMSNLKKQTVFGTFVNSIHIAMLLLHLARIIFQICSKKLC